MSKSPGIILTCQYTMPNQKSFGDYLDYMTREEALEEISNRTLDEEIELQEIKSKIYNYEFFYSPQDSYLETSNSSDQTDIELEANGILKHTVDLDKLQDKDFTTYISYMARQYALEKKGKLTTAEEIEQENISESLKNLTEKNPTEKTPEYLAGVFSCSSDQVSVSDLKEIKDVFRKGQNHGSIIYQDVISHDNGYLEKLGLYDSKTDTLDEVGLKRAGKEMMDKLFEKEKLNETGYWMASIHRNTKHIHIHFAIVESQNTRPIVTEKVNGEVISMPKGKRKQATLDEMKTAYSQELNRYSFEIGQQKQLDRRALLTRKSELRNLLVKEVKAPRRYDKEALKLLNEIYRGLPEKKNDWNYGTENKTKLPIEVRSKLDQLTEHILTSDVRFEEYNSISEQLRKEARETFGKSSNKSKDAQGNALFDLRKRTGNAILTSLKQQDQQMIELIQGSKNQKNMISVFPDERSDQNPKIFKQPGREVDEQKTRPKSDRSEPSMDYFEAFQGRNYDRSIVTYNKKSSLNKSTEESKRPDYKRRRLTRRSLRQVSNTIAAHEEKYQAQRAYEIQQRRIQFEQERR